MIEFYCPRCGHEFRAEQSQAGLVGTCHGCGDRIRVPGRPTKLWARLPDARFESTSQTESMAERLRQKRSRRRLNRREIFAAVILGSFGLFLGWLEQKWQQRAAEADKQVPKQIEGRQQRMWENQAKRNRR